jgi:pantoate--beta-alanine ligase
MQVIERISEIRDWSEAAHLQRQRIALVPTMGFLHEGHLSLVRDARARADRVVVSIFVNPKQFGPQEDLASYPRDFERDRNLLDRENVDVVFHPTADEIYPDGYQTQIDVENLGALLCGASRPGHFCGVATIVAKLFNIVRPNIAIFGCKDYQQLQIIRRMVRDLNFNIEIVGHPIVREPDGLAMSSRNAYLNPAERKAALCLSRALLKAQEQVQKGQRSAAPLREVVRQEIANEPLASLDYVSLSDPETLVEIEKLTDNALLALAVRIGQTRLIDNKLLKA